MTFDSDKHHRRSIRLKSYDYSQTGAYFVTICVRDGVCLFGEIVDGTMRMNDYGRIVAEAWRDLGRRFKHIELDEFVVMPNHVHGIIHVGAPFMAPDDNGMMSQGAMNRAPTLGEMVRTFKAVSSHAIRQNGIDFRWQRNYYERVIRNENELARIREYIANNPTQWALDRENPNVGALFITP